jgi:hypothetical protein
MCVISIKWRFLDDISVIIRGLVATVRASIPAAIGDKLHVASKSLASNLSLKLNIDMSAREPHCYVLYAGLVFGLGLARKVLRKFDTGRDSVNLMVSGFTGYLT